MAKAIFQKRKIKMWDCVLNKLKGTYPNLEYTKEFF